MNHFIELQEPNGTIVYFNASQIVAITASGESGTFILANGNKYEVKQSVKTVQEKLKQAGCTMPV